MTPAVTEIRSVMFWSQTWGESKNEHTNVMRETRALTAPAPLSEVAGAGLLIALLD